VGGLVGRTDESQITNSVSTGYVSGSSSTGGLLGSGYASAVSNSYWAIDSSGQTSSAYSSEATGYVGITLATLQCATEANTTSANSSCVSSDGAAEGLSAALTLFNSWQLALQNGQAVWDFGTATQLPALVLNGTTYRDSDGDSILDTDDSMPFDSDNDGLDNLQDVYPFIAIGNLTDTDNDGIPDICDADCLALGMMVDLDNDNDGIQDLNDVYPLIAIGNLTDTDNDGAPDGCGLSCVASGMSADLDDDNDGILDVDDGYPLVALGNLTDIDNDGIPDRCNKVCFESGMAADTDDDNDGVLDIDDAYPLISLGGLTDTDNDGIPNSCDSACIALGMAADLDNDNDGLGDITDPDIGADNGLPEMISVPDESSVAVTTADGDAFELLADASFFNLFYAIDVVDTVFVIEGSINDEVLSIDENDMMLIPAGMQTIEWVAIDTSGNRSKPMDQVMNVYPSIRFDKATSITGEPSSVGIKVSLTGESPVYPVTVTLEVNQISDTDQADFNGSFDIGATQQIMINAGDGDTFNRDAYLYISVLDDRETENDELLIVDLLSVVSGGEAGDLFTVDTNNQQHALTITGQNLMPTVEFKLEQGGVEVESVEQHRGLVTLTAMVQDGNDYDSHTYTWDLGSLELITPIGNVLIFDPSSVDASTYSVTVTVTDDGVGQLEGNDSIDFEVVGTLEREGPEINPVDAAAPSGGSGGGTAPWFMLMLMFALFGRRNALYKYS
jgi:hypothetical protein